MIKSIGSLKLNSDENTAETCMDAFIDKLSYIAWAFFIGIGILALFLAAAKFKLDAWLERVLGLIDANKNSNIAADLAMAVAELESGSLDSKLCNNDEFFYLTEAIMFGLLYKRLKPLQNEHFVDAEESVITAVKKFYFYMTRTKRYYKMEPKIFLATKRKKGFDIN